MSSFRVSPLLWSAFFSTSGLIVTEMSILGALSDASQDTFDFGVGAGIGFCALGTLVASLSLNWVSNLLDHRKLAIWTVFFGYLMAAIIWLLGDRLPLVISIYISAAIFAALYVFLNYCVSVSVYHEVSSELRAKLAKRMAFPYFSAQAVVPIISGFLHDTYGILPLTALLAFCYTYPLAYLLRVPQQRFKSEQKPFSRYAIPIMSVPGILLSVSSVSSFGLNWYFSSILTTASNQHISTTLIGGVMSALNLAAIIGAGWIARLNLRSLTQLNALAMSTLVCGPIVIAIHSTLEPVVSIAPGILVIFMGVLTGISASLMNTLKYAFIEEKSYANFLRWQNLLNTTATLVGSIIGSIAAETIGLKESLIACIVVMLAMSVLPALWLFRSAQKILVSP